MLYNVEVSNGVIGQFEANSPEEAQALAQAVIDDIAKTTTQTPPEIVTVEAS